MAKKGSSLILKNIRRRRSATFVRLKTCAKTFTYLMKERRKYKRVAIRISVKWESEKFTKRNLADAVLFNTRNITQRGLFLKTNLRPRKGSHLSFELKIPKSSKPIRLKGKTVWLAKKTKQPHLYPGIGIKFEKPSPDDGKRLRTFLQNKFRNFRDAIELKNMYIKLKGMASRLVELEERHTSAIHFKRVVDNAISEIDDVAHILDKEINAVKKM